MEVKSHMNNTRAAAKRWPRPLKRVGRWIEVTNTADYWQINRDFGKWPLNGGWPLNRWPLNRGRTVITCISSVTWVTKRTFEFNFELIKSVLTSSTVVYWRRIKQLALICFSPLSAFISTHSLPQELSSCCPNLHPLEPNPILELQER